MYNHFKLEYIYLLKCYTVSYIHTPTLWAWPILLYTQCLIVNYYYGCAPLCVYDYYITLLTTKDVTGTIGCPL